ncbi:DMT family transporter [Parapedobacter sp. 10938]|uniref:DMT family transporter n=1 Tax=Parapedobacter flavus TaxID=3110225 RepID=UPI002DB8FEFD|nr:DMT family transporter [Parapedobacter sp. 10938]MEC3879198.1 DMT family transporter [Parapedobacter sp. 10938]
MKSSIQRAGYVIAGTVFAILWASASAATKIGLLAAQPFMIAIARFAVAATVMLVIAHLVMGQRLPAGWQLWKRLSIYGFLNVGLYLGLYVVAMQNVSAGLGTLFVATNPVLITVMGAVWYKQPVGWSTVVSFMLCIVGMLLASYPLLGESYATPAGLTVLFLSMLSYSAGSIYFARQDWGELHILAINGWQTLIGGLCVVPFAVFFHEGTANTFDGRFWGAVLWLAIAVSVVAMLLWLYLLRDNPIKASAWLFLCPIAGFAIAAVLMDEPLSWHTGVGVLLVMVGLYIVQRRRAISR